MERQREALRRQIIDLTFLVHGPDVMPLQKLDKSAPERAFLNYLEDKLEEKKAQLHALDLQIAQASTFRARFHSELQLARCHLAGGSRDVPGNCHLRQSFQQYSGRVNGYSDVGLAALGHLVLFSSEIDPTDT